MNNGMRNGFDSAPVFIVGFVVLAIIFIVVAMAQQKKRREEYAALAARLGFTFYEGGLEMSNNLSLSNLFGFSGASQDYGTQFTSFFSLFDRGSARTIRPAIVGYDSHGNEWFLFDYQYTVSNGKSSITYRFGVVVVKSTLVFPAMSLSPEGFGHAVGKLFGSREMQVESEDFNQRYFIKSSDEKMTLDLLHPVAIEALLSQPTHNWEMSGPFMMLHQSGTLAMEEFEHLMGCMNQFLDLIPTYYRQDYGATGAHS